MHSLNLFGTTYESELQKARKRFSTMTTKNMYGHNKRVCSSFYDANLCSIYVQGNYLAWNSTGEKLGSGSHDETIRIWTGVERKGVRDDVILHMPLTL
jgi:hypothetical protein